METFSAHILAAHKPERKEKYGETVLRLLTENGNSMDKDELMTKCNLENPNLSKKDVKKYSSIITRLAKDGKVRMRTIVELVAE